MTDKWKPPSSDEIVSSGQETWKPPEEDMVVSRDPGIVDYIKGFSGAIGEGMTTILGAPTDITSSVLRKLGIVSEETPPPFGGKESLKRGLESVGFGFPKPPDTTGGRIIARAGEEVGAAVFPMMGMYGVALKTAPVVSSMARKMFLDPIAKAPGTSAIQDIISTTASGGGAGVAREVVPESKTAETAGQVVGGFAPAATALSPTRLAIKGVRALYSRFNSKAQIEAAKEAVQKVMGGALDREALESMTSARAITERTGGQFQPSIAESTGIPSLVATQKQLEREASDEFLNWVTQRRVNNEKAIENYIQRSAPSGEVSPEIVIDTASNKIILQGKDLERNISSIVQSKQDLAKKLPTIDKISSGAVLRESLIKARAAASTKMSEVADGLGLAKIDMTDAFEEWKRGVRTNYKSVSRFEDSVDKPKILTEIINDNTSVSKAGSPLAGAYEDVDYGDFFPPTTKEIKPTSFIDIKTLRERVSDDLIDELSSANPSRRKVRTLVMLKKDVDTLFDTAGGEAGEGLAAFRKQYFEEYVKPFETGAMFKAKNKDGTGFFRSRDEQVADLFLDNPTSARQFRTVFADDSATMKTLEDAFLDKMRSTIAPDGTIDEKKLGLFIKKNDDVLKELPSLREKISDIDTAQKVLVTRQRDLATRQDAIDRNALVKQLTRYSEGKTTADVVLDSALKDSRKMQSLKIFLRNDPEALDTLKRTIWEKATQGDAASILKFMAENEKSLVQLFSPAHFNAIQDITAMRTMAEVIPTQPGMAHIPTPFEHIEKMVGMGIPQASTRWYALMTGRLAKSYLIADISKSILLSKGKANIENLLRDALYDPAVAYEMASAVRTGKFTESMGRRLSARVFALGLPYLRGEQKEE